MRAGLVGAVLGMAAWAAGCRCSSSVEQVKASLQVTPPSVTFGPTKVGTTRKTSLKLEAASKAPVTLGNARVSGTGFRVGSSPSTIGALSSATLEVFFEPTTVAAFSGSLTLESNDAEHPEIQIPLAGEGMEPKLAATPECDPARKCHGTVALSPPAIHFGAEPLRRASPIAASELPSINLVSEGEVELTITKIAIEGPDAAAFTFAIDPMLPAGGLVLNPSEGVNVAIRFVPTSASQTSYAATAVIESNDLAAPRVIVALDGTLAPNSAPVVCVNLIKVQPVDDPEADYSSDQDWAPLIPAPAGGYDFTLSRPVEPRAGVVFSAFSPKSDGCTSDPEDGRSGLTFSWKLTAAPVGASGLGLSGATSPQCKLNPVVSGLYTIELTVKDALETPTVVTMRFAVALRQDLVVQLQWPGFSDVDLDLHLVRPSAVTQPADPFSGAFAFFDNGTSGDINGWSAIAQKNNPGFDFNWGLGGTSDDPRMNIDDTGSGVLLENASLNHPENDAQCATAGCRYKVFVHYFKDGRAGGAPMPCVVDGGAACSDGQGCGCSNSARCVTDSAPKGDAGTGSGKCYLPPKPVVKVFLKGSALPAATIPLPDLMPPDDLALGAPCQMLYVADVEWPALTTIGSLPDGGTPLAKVFPRGAADGGRIESPSLARFGWRPAGGTLQCSPNVSEGAGLDWYAREP